MDLVSNFIAIIHSGKQGNDIIIEITILKCEASFSKIRIKSYVDVVRGSNFKFVIFEHCFCQCSKTRLFQTFF